MKKKTTAQKKFRTPPLTIHISSEKLNDIDRKVLAYRDWLIGVERAQLPKTIASALACALGFKKVPTGKRFAVFIARAERHIEELEEKFRARDEDFGIPYQGNPLVGGLRTIVLKLKEESDGRVRSDGGSVLEWLLNELKPIEREVLRLRYGIGCYGKATFCEISNAISRTPATARNIHNKALRRLRHPINRAKVQKLVDPPTGLLEAIGYTRLP